MLRWNELNQITVTENIAYRTDVGQSTVLDLAKPTFGPQADRPAILIIHGGIYEQPNGGDNARMVRAWLDWQLKDKTEHSKLFIDGALSDYEGFTIKHKNFNQ